MSPPILSEKARRLLLDQFTPEQLRHIAALKEGDSPGMRARRLVDATAVDELVEMISAGETPTIGWWKRHTKRSESATTATNGADLAKEVT